MKWSEVQCVHRTQKGIYTREGRVVSLLCSQNKDSKYADHIGEDFIRYRVTSTTTRTGVAGLEALVGTNQTLRVFEKVGVNNWCDHGAWVVSEVHRTDMWTATFVLRRFGSEVDETRKSREH